MISLGHKLLRHTEGIGWKEVGKAEINGIKYKVVQTTKNFTWWIKESDYANRECYPASVPAFRPLKEDEHAYSNQKKVKRNRRIEKAVNALRENGGWMSASQLGKLIGLDGRTTGHIISISDDIRIQRIHPETSNGYLYRYMEVEE